MANHGGRLVGVLGLMLGMVSADVVAQARPPADESLGQLIEHLTDRRSNGLIFKDFADGSASVDLQGRFQQVLPSPLSTMTALGRDSILPRPSSCRLLATILMRIWAISVWPYSMRLQISGVRFWTAASLSRFSETIFSRTVSKCNHESYQMTNLYCAAT